MLALSRRAAPEGIDGGDKVRVQVLDVRVDWSNDRSGEEMGKRRTGDGRIGPIVGPMSLIRLAMAASLLMYASAHASSLAAPRGAHSCA